MHVRFLSVLLLSFLFVPTIANAQVGPACYSTLACHQSPEQRRYSPLHCLQEKSTSFARDCKSEIIDQKYGEPIGFLAQLPFLILFLVTIAGAVTIPPMKGWLNGYATGFVIGVISLLIAGSNGSWALPIKPLLHYTSFPVTGLMSFSPKMLTAFSFEIEFVLVHMILFGGSMGFYSIKNRRTATLATTLFIVLALSLSIANIIII